MKSHFQSWVVHGSSVMQAFIWGILGRKLVFDGMEWSLVNISATLMSFGFRLVARINTHMKILFFSSMRLFVDVPVASTWRSASCLLQASVSNSNSYAVRFMAKQRQTHYASLRF